MRRLTSTVVRPLAFATASWRSSADAKVVQRLTCAAATWRRSRLRARNFAVSSSESSPASVKTRSRSSETGMSRWFLMSSRRCAWRGHIPAPTRSSRRTSSTFAAVLDDDVCTARSEHPIPKHGTCASLEVRPGGHRAGRFQGRQTGHGTATSRHLDRLASLDTRHDPLQVLLQFADRNRRLTHVRHLYDKRPQVKRAPAGTARSRSVIPDRNWQFSLPSLR